MVFYTVLLIVEECVRRLCAFEVQKDKTVLVDDSVWLSNSKLL